MDGRGVLFGEHFGDAFLLLFFESLLSLWLSFDGESVFSVCLMT